MEGQAFYGRKCTQNAPYSTSATFIGERKQMCMKKLTNKREGKGREGGVKDDKKKGKGEKGGVKDNKKKGKGEKGE